MVQRHDTKERGREEKDNCGTYYSLDPIVVSPITICGANPNEEKRMEWLGFEPVCRALLFTRRVERFIYYTYM